MKLFIVGQIKGEWRAPEDGGTAWEFQGAFDTRPRADAACRDESYCVFEAQLNQELPHESIIASGWYPKA